MFSVLPWLCVAGQQLAGPSWQLTQHGKYQAVHPQLQLHLGGPFAASFGLWSQPSAVPIGRCVSPSVQPPRRVPFAAAPREETRKSTKCQCREGWQSRLSRRAGYDRMGPKPSLPLVSNHSNLIENQLELAILVPLPGKYLHEAVCKACSKIDAQCLLGSRPSVFKWNAVCAVSSDAYHPNSKIEFYPSLPNEPISNSIRKS